MKCKPQIRYGEDNIPRVKQQKSTELSSGERVFDTYWIMFGWLDMPYEHNYKFHEVRRWAFDFAWPRANLAVEIEGGAFNGGRHTRGVGFTEDCVKYNAAAVKGWRVLRFTPQMLKDEPEGSINQVLALLQPFRLPRFTPQMPQDEPEVNIKEILTQLTPFISGDVCRCETFKGNGMKCETCGGWLF